MRLVASLPIFALIWTTTATTYAQGYYSGTQGARATGRAGAFTARADDLSAVELNPAGLANIGTTLIQVGNRFSHNAYDYTRQPTLDWGRLDSNGNATPVQFAQVHNQQPWQYLDPLLGVGTNLGLKNWGFAVVAYAPAGIAREQYPDDGGQRYMMLKRQTQMLNYSFSAAWKLREVFGIGATFQWIAVPSLNYQLVINGNPLPRRAIENPVSSSTDTRATVSGSDLFTPNAVIGAWYRPVSYLQWGLSAQVIPSTIRIHGNLAAEIADSGNSETVVLRRNHVPANDVTLTLPLPIKIREGVRYRHIRNGREQFDLELDVAYEFWSRVQQITLETNGLVGAYKGQDVNIGRVDLQKHWRNTVTIQLGGDVLIVPDALTLRGGAFYISRLSDPAYTQIDFVSGPQVGGALGASIYAGSLEVALAYEYRRQLPVSLSEQESHVYQQAPGSPCSAPYIDPLLCNQHYYGIPSPPVNAGKYEALSQVVALDLLY